MCTIIVSFGNFYLDRCTVCSLIHISQWECTLITISLRFQSLYGSDLASMGLSLACFHLYGSRKQLTTFSINNIAPLMWVQC